MQRANHRGTTFVLLQTCSNLLSPVTQTRRELLLIHPMFAIPAPKLPSAVPFRKTFQPMSFPLCKEDTGILLFLSACFYLLTNHKGFPTVCQRLFFSQFRSVFCQEFMGHLLRVPVFLIHQIIESCHNICIQNL